jgi:hypothetical protein
VDGLSLGPWSRLCGRPISEHHPRNEDPPASIPQESRKPIPAGQFRRRACSEPRAIQNPELLTFVGLRRIAG